MINPAGGSGAKEGRDSACTPEWLARVLGKFDIDPCSNPRSHIWATLSLSLEHGDNGLSGERGVYERRMGNNGIAVCQAWDNTEVFVNPPYKSGEVIRWVKHWRHARFCFLLRWDPSTRWFAEILPHCTHVWFPERRINFEPPPGVTFSTNPFPHALFLRDPPAERLERLALHGYLIPVDSGLLRSHHVSHVEEQAGDGGHRNVHHTGGALGGSRDGGGGCDRELPSSDHQTRRGGGPCGVAARAAPPDAGGAEAGDWFTYFLSSGQAGYADNFQP